MYSLVIFTQNYIWMGNDMEKEQAIEYVIDRLNAGDKISDISVDLSEMLNAPDEIVINFVRNIWMSYQPNQQGFDPKNNVEVGLEPDHQNLPEEIRDSDPNDINQTNNENLTVTTNDQGGVEPPVSSKPRVEPEPSIPKDFNKTALITLVTQNTKKYRRHNDIIETVCKETDWTWNQAQRFVAKVQTEFHDEISKSQRNFMIPFSLGITIGGLLLLLWSASTLIDYYSAYTSLEPSTLPADFVPLVIAVIISSLGIVSGGVFGLYKTLSTR